MAIFQPTFTSTPQGTLNAPLPFTPYQPYVPPTYAAPQFQQPTATPQAQGAVDALFAKYLADGASSAQYHPLRVEYANKYGITVEPEEEQDFFNAMKLKYGLAALLARPTGYAEPTTMPGVAGGGMGGMGGIDSTAGSQGGNVLGGIALGNAISSAGTSLGNTIGSSLGLTGLGQSIAGPGINALGAMEAQSAANDAAHSAMGALAGLSDASVGLGELGAIAAADAATNAGNFGDAASAAASGYGAADAVGQSGFDSSGNFGSTDASSGLSAADGVGASGFGDTGSFGGDSGSSSGSDSGGGGGGGGGKIICTKLHELGAMPDDIYEADQAFGALLLAQSPETYAGYAAWAQHVVRWMGRDDWFGALVRRAAHAIATPWSIAMAEEMGLPVKSSWFGRALLRHGLQLCRFIGQRRAEVQHG